MAEDVTSIIKESIDAVLQNQQYNHFKVRHCQDCWTGCVSSRSLLTDSTSAGWSVDIHLPRNLHQTVGRAE